MNSLVSFCVVLNRAGQPQTREMMLETDPAKGAEVPLLQNVGYGNEPDGTRGVRLRWEFGDNRVSNSKFFCNKKIWGNIVSSGGSGVECAPASYLCIGATQIRFAYRGYATLPTLTTVGRVMGGKPGRDIACLSLETTEG